MLKGLNLKLVTDIKSLSLHFAHLFSHQGVQKNVTGP